VSSVREREREKNYGGKDLEQREEWKTPWDKLTAEDEG